MKPKRFWIGIGTVAAIAATVLLNVTLTIPATGQTPAEVGYSHSTLDLLGVVWAVEVEGDYAYLGVDDRLVIVDISVPLSPVKLGETTRIADPWCGGIVFGHVFDVVVSGDYAYVAADARGIQVVKVSDPLHPYAVSPGVGPSSPVGVATEGTTLVVGENNCFDGAVTGGVMSIYDLINPEDPDEIFYTGWAGYIPLAQNNIVAIAKNHAYAAASFRKTLIVVSINDLTDVRYTHGDWPNSPDGFTPTGLIAYGDYLYITASADNGGEMLAIFDISDPFRPHWITSFPKPRADSMAVANGKLYIAYDETIEAYDLVDPINPELLFSHVLDETVQDIDAQGNCVYAGVASNLHIFCASDPVVTPTPSLTPTSTPTLTPTQTPTPTSTVTPTVTNTATSISPLTPTATPSPSPTAMGERRLYLPLIYGYGS